MSAAPLIAVEGLGVSFGPTPALEDVSLAVCPGEIVALTGPNGSGKSTLIRVLIGALAPGRGLVRRAEGLRLGYVPQRLPLDPNLPMTLSRFLSLPGGLPPGAAAAALEHAGLAGRGRAQVSQLSGGQVQRALLARALLSDPQLLILDEAAAGLDPEGAAAFHARLAALRAARGTAILMVSHDLASAFAIADRVVVLGRRVLAEGTPQDVLRAPGVAQAFGLPPGICLAIGPHIPPQVAAE